MDQSKVESKNGPLKRCCTIHMRFSFNTNWNLSRICRTQATTWNMSNPTFNLLYSSALSFFTSFLIYFLFLSFSTSIKYLSYIFLASLTKINLKSNSRVGTFLSDKITVFVDFCFFKLLFFSLLLASVVKWRLVSFPSRFKNCKRDILDNRIQNYLSRTYVNLPFIK